MKETAHILAYIGIGSNMGERAEYIRRALALMSSTEGITVETVSSIIETDAVGHPSGPKYLNAVARISTGLSPRRLLTVLLEIERTLGRERKVRWGPRTIDLDILLYDTVTIDEEGLSIPHPRMHQRSFVIEPLLEIAPALSGFIDRLKKKYSHE
jgi:2-amino-4-hydroxy-6-hydroxymethyldihydropteridine diphosphokinase